MQQYHLNQGKFKCKRKDGKLNHMENLDHISLQIQYARESVGLRSICTALMRMSANSME